jgi:RNA polymerase sigma-70 factor, ECF subfamily
MSRPRPHISHRAPGPGLRYERCAEYGGSSLITNDGINRRACSGVCSNVMMARHAEAPTGAANFETLYRQELAPLIALATTMTGNRDLGADLAHEALARAYRDWRTVGSLDRPGAWVRRVLINLTVDAHRRAARETQAVLRLDPHPLVALAEVSSETFWAAVRALPERQRAAVTLFYIEDLAIAEIADILGIARGTVKTSLFMARRSLAISLGAEEVLDANDR